MYQTIVVGCDGSAHGLAAARFAAWLAQRLGARLIVAAAYTHTAHVRTDGGAAEGQARAEAEAAAHAGVAAVGGVGAARALVASGSSPAAVLHDVARAEQADLLVVGTSERRRIAGTQPGERHGARAPSQSVPGRRRAAIGDRADGAAPRRRDGRPAARARRARRRPVARGGARARARGDRAPARRAARAHVPPPGSPAPGGHERWRLPAWLGTLADDLDAPVPVRVVTEAGGAGAMLAERAHDLDLLVMGSRDLGAVRRVVLGSVSTHVVRHAPCPVIVELGYATAERADDVVTTARTAR